MYRVSSSLALQLVAGASHPKKAELRKLTIRALGEGAARGAPGTAVEKQGTWALESGVGCPRVGSTPVRRSNCPIHLTMIA